jgi:adenosine deaminase
LNIDTIRSWPKAELHCHLDGSVRLDTLLQLAARQGKSSLLPSDSNEGLRDAFEQVDESNTLEDYLSWFKHTIGLLQSRSALQQVAYELVADAAEENVTYLEVRYSPILHTAEGLTLDQVNRAVLDGLEQGGKDTGTRTGLIICGMRDRLESTSLRLAELAVDYFGKGYFARNNLLNLTVHAGESWGPESIHQALFRCGAHRIGHGTSLFQDPALMRYCVNHQVPLEVCPTSNVQTKVVEDYANHPLRTYVEAGVPVTISTDNRLFSRTTLTEELWRVHTRCDVDADSLQDIVINGFKFSFLPWDERLDMVEDVKERVNMLSSKQ